VGAGVGAVLGLVAGALATPSNDWVEIPGVKRVGVVVRPRSRGVAAALAMRW
jgi:hypothetical protein